MRNSVEFDAGALADTGDIACPQVGETVLGMVSTDLEIGGRNQGADAAKGKLSDVC